MPLGCETGTQTEPLPLLAPEDLVVGPPVIVRLRPLHLVPGAMVDFPP